MRTDVVVMESAAQVANEVAKATEATILEQLNDFISRGLIEIQMVGPTFVRDPYMHPTKVRIEQSCRLVLKDKEYIQKLEQENRELREILAKLRSAM